MQTKLLLTLAVSLGVIDLVGYGARWTGQLAAENANRMVVQSVQQEARACAQAVAGQSERTDAVARAESECRKALVKADAALALYAQGGPRDTIISYVSDSRRHSKNAHELITCGKLDCSAAKT